MVKRCDSRARERNRGQTANQTAQNCAAVRACVPSHVILLKI